MFVIAPVDTHIRASINADVHWNIMGNVNVTNPKAEEKDQFLNRFLFLEISTLLTHDRMKVARTEWTNEYVKQAFLEYQNW